MGSNPTLSAKVKGFQGFYTMRALFAVQTKISQASKIKNDIQK
jgi:hypothetical protein